MCWKEIKLDGIIYSTSLEVECFQEFLFSLPSTLKALEFGRFAMVLWAIWRMRNDVVWRDACPSARVLVHYALGFLYDWLHVRSKVGENIVLASRVCCKWPIPQSPLVTCNVDASFSHGLGRTGLGILLSG